MWPLLLCNAWHILKERQQLPEVQLAVYKEQCLKYGVSVSIIDYISPLGEHASPPPLVWTPDPSGHARKGLGSRLYPQMLLWFAQDFCNGSFLNLSVSHPR